MVKCGKAGECDEFISTAATSATRTRHPPPSAKELHFKLHLSCTGGECLICDFSFSVFFSVLFQSRKWILEQKMFLHTKLRVAGYQTASVSFLVYTFLVYLLYLHSHGLQLGFPWKVEKCSKFLTASPDCTSPRCFS